MTMKQIREWVEKGLATTDPLLCKLAIGKLESEAKRRGLTLQELLSVVRGENG